MHAASSQCARAGSARAGFEQRTTSLPSDAGDLHAESSDRAGSTCRRLRARGRTRTSTQRLASSSAGKQNGQD